MALLGLLLAATFATGAQARVSGFQSLAPSSVPLTAVASDPGSGLLYAQENNGTSFFRYDPQTNVWTELAPSPVNSGNNGGAAYLAGKIYVVYTEINEMAIYDIATNSWTAMPSPLGEGTGDITSANNNLYLADDLNFVQYEPATGITTPLAEPPKFEVSCHEGFEPWGGLQFDGTKIYGHQGDGCNGFGVYDVAGNSWAELPLVPFVEPIGGGEPEGAVLGSALDPITNTYLTYGPYEGNTLFRYDIEANAWTTATLPFTEIDDGGMAYIATPGHEGVYMIEGEEGTGFGRYTEQNTTDLSPSMSAAVVGSATGGEITYSIQVKNNGPERASGVVLSDPPPAGTTLVSAGTSQGTCIGTPPMTCSLGVLHSGASANLTIKVKAGFGTVTNKATVSSQAIDTNASNDSATVVSTVPACVVPKLRGRRLKGAKKALRAAHCKPGKVSHRFSRKLKKGRVVHVGRHRGTVLPAGSKVKLSVSRGAKHKGHHKSKGAR